MSSPTPFEIKLIQKITVAKMHLKDIKIEHKSGCVTEDVTSHASCNCGASRINSKIEDALEELSLDK